MFGLGNNKRIVLFDTLVDQCSTEQVGFLLVVLGCDRLAHCACTCVNQLRPHETLPTACPATAQIVAVLAHELGVRHALTGPVWIASMSAFHAPNVTCLSVG